ncbi:MAG TPA: hypothetical protein VMY18_04755 [Acidobacteriota bacterium]|nr:hypothetical protein [Acidobacteriota bacterium]
MGEDGSIRKVGRVVVRGVAQEKREKAKERLEESTIAFRHEASDRIDSVAQQVRQLGTQFDRHEDAHQIARRLEKTSDYLRFRPAADVAGDALALARKYRLLWLTGGLLAGVIIYRLAIRKKSSAR